MPPNDFFEATQLPDEQKELFCRSLLEEFGVVHINRTDRGELIHSCCLPNSGHRNGDRNPSASLNYRKLTYNCLGCGSSGGLLWFIATCRGQDTHDAYQWLQGHVGLGQTTMELGTLLELIDQMYAQHAEGRSPIPRYSSSVLDAWTFPMFHPYLSEIRGIPEETLTEFKLGYAPEYFDGTERIIIPHYWKKELVGWQARRLCKTDEPKYKNSPDFPKDRTLYGKSYHEDMIVVESPLSVLARWHHMPMMDATFGAKVTEDQIRVIQRVPGKVILWFDNDNAGWKATRHVAERLWAFCDVLVVDSPYAADAADFDDKTAQSLVDDAIPYSIWEPPTTLIPWRKP